MDDAQSALVIIDQTKLPVSLELLSLTGTEEIRDAIRSLRVRGAPAIGVAAAMGLYLAAKAVDTSDFNIFIRAIAQAKQTLASARPTAVNLFWALERMERAALAHSDKPVARIKERLRAEALRIRDEDIAACRAIGEHGLTLLKDGGGILTHCNAGHLAAVRYGTALAPIYIGQEKGFSCKIFACETRPLLQGARLTAYELTAAGADVTLICDNMASRVMQGGRIQAVITGCDRLAANGDACNKIGTSGLAVLAKHYGIPFYLCAPASTVDLQTASGEGIPVEERGADEVTGLWYSQPMAPEGVRVYNPSFDVTPHSLISAIVTERGIVRPPYRDGLKKIFE